ncbi:MAG: hypothetical protein WC798_00155 [Candidatus Paceibacterota bacterium]|jgi:hypothetical protein
MKKISIVVLALAIVVLATSVHAEWRWEHFGADPYAKTRAEAMRTRESAFRKLGFPEPVLRLFMEETQKPGERVRLTVGDKLSSMLSHKGAIVRKDVVVAFGSPTKGMEYAAPAEEWQVPWEGRVFILILPEVCYNWSAKVPVIDIFGSQEKCVELSFNAQPGGFVRWGDASNDGPLPPSACNAQKQGDGPWQTWYGKCDDCVGAIEYIRGILGSGAEIPHKYFYSVIAPRQTLRFSEAVWKDVVYICQEYADGKRTCGVYMRPQDWQGSHAVAIKDSFWISDANCPK